MAYTAKQLWDSAKKVAVGRKLPSASGSRRAVRVIPYSQFKAVLFQFEHHGITQACIHGVNLYFWNLEVTEEERPTISHLKVPYQNKMVYVEKPDFYIRPCRVRCTCLDYYFTFSYWNWMKGAQFGGKPRPYIRKSRRKPRNPNHYPGFCKHIYNSLELMAFHGWTAVRQDRYVGTE